MMFLESLSCLFFGFARVPRPPWPSLLCAVLTSFTLRRAYILTSLVLSVPGLPLPPPSRAWWVQSRVLLALLAPRAVPGFLRLALIPLVSGWGYALYESLSKDRCLVLRCWRDSNPRLPTACVRFPTPLYNQPAAPVCRLQHHVWGPFAGPVAFMPPASARCFAGCMRSGWWRRWACAVSCAPTRSRAG